KVIVFNNRSLGMVQLEMQLAGYPDWQTATVNPPFHKVADLMGFTVYKIRAPEQVQPQSKDALKQEGPALDTVFTDRDALAMPPKVDFDQMSGYMKSMVKLMSEGRTNEVLESVKSNIGHLRELF